MFGRALRYAARASLLIVILGLTSAWIWSHQTSHGVLYLIDNARTTLDSAPAFADWRLSVDHTNGVLAMELSKHVQPARYSTNSVRDVRVHWMRKPVLPGVAQQQERQDIRALEGGWRLGPYGASYRRVQAYGTDSGFWLNARTPTAVLVCPLALVTGVLVMIDVRRRRRRTRHLCVGCGYSLVGLPPGSRCPECGKKSGGEQALE